MKYFVSFIVLVAGVAFAQTVVMQGKPGNQGAWPVTLSSGGGGSIPVVGPDGGVVQIAGTVIVVGPDGGVVQINGSVVGSDGGAVDIQTPCNTVVESVTTTGLTSLPVPATAQSSRKMIVICNSPENTNSPILKCRADGVVPVIGVAAAGQALGKGDCITYSTSATNADAGSIINCISDTASTAATSSECK